MDRDREAFDVAARAREAWNACADRFNQWDDLGGDERESFIAMFSAGWQAALAYARGEREVRDDEQELDAADLALIDAAWEHHRDAVPAARVINDNQPATTAVIEVLCSPPTLEVGTELYRRPRKFAADDAWKNDATRLADKIEDLAAEFGADAIPMIGEWIGAWRHNRRLRTPSPVTESSGCGTDKAEG